MKTIQYQLQDGIANVTFDEPNSPVNTMCSQWQRDMTALVEQIVKDKDAIKGIILTSAKSTFFAGADLKGAMRLQPSDASAIFTEIERVKKNFRTLELLPGASGVTKMTRHLGLMGAQPYLIEGKIFSPQEAKTLGLVHELVAPSASAAAEMRNSALAWIAANPSAQHPWEAKGYKVPGGLPSNPAVAQMLAVAPAMIKQQTRGLYPAPEAIMACMVEGLQVDVPTALRIESRYLAKLMTGINARAMINTFFFNLNAIKSGVSRPGAAPRFKPTKVGLKRA